METLRATGVQTGCQGTCRGFLATISADNVRRGKLKGAICGLDHPLPHADFTVILVATSGYHSLSVIVLVCILCVLFNTLLVAIYEDIVVELNPVG